MITAASSTTALQTRLVSSGVSTAKAKLVQDDLDSAIKAVGGDGSTKPASVRAALDQKIAADVASGKLSEEDAATIDKALDRMGDASVAASGESGSASSQTTAVPAGGGQGGGGGAGGGGSASKTELSRIVTVAGAIKTTVITYTDGTSETSTSAASSEDKARYGHAAAAEADTDPQAKVGAFLASVTPGSLMDAEA